MGDIFDVLNDIKKQEAADIISQSFTGRAGKQILGNRLDVDPTASKTDNFAFPFAQGLLGGALSGFGQRRSKDIFSERIDPLSEALATRDPRTQLQELQSSSIDPRQISAAKQLEAAFGLEDRDRALDFNENLEKALLSKGLLRSPEGGLVKVPGFEAKPVIRNIGGRVQAIDPNTLEVVRDLGAAQSPIQVNTGRGELNRGEIFKIGTDAVNRISKFPSVERLDQLESKTKTVEALLDLPGLPSQEAIVKGFGLALEPNARALTDQDVTRLTRQGVPETVIGFLNSLVGQRSLSEGTLQEMVESMRRATEVARAEAKRDSGFELSRIEASFPEIDTDAIFNQGKLATRQAKERLGQGSGEVRPVDVQKKIAQMTPEQRAARLAELEAKEAR